MMNTDFSYEEKIVVGKETLRLPLNDNSIWIIENGSVDLFAVGKDGDDSRNHRYFLKEFSIGSVLFGFPLYAEYETIAVIAPGSSLLRIKAESFYDQLSKNRSIAETFIPHFNEWASGLYSLFSKYKALADTRIFTSQQRQSLHLKKGEKVVFEHMIGEENERTVNWMNLEAGALVFLGWKEAELEAPSFFPLRNDLWWEVKKPALLSAASPLKMIEEGKLRPAVHQFIEWFLRALKNASQEEIRREKKIFGKKTRLEELSLKDSLNSLASVLKEEKKEAKKQKDPLFSTCLLLGQHLNVTFQKPRAAPSSNLEKKLADICEASKIRYRKVTLEGKWWKENGDHFLGFLGEKLQPVALVKKGKKYEMVHPDTHSSEVVNAKTAKELFDVAFCFYPPIPDDVSSLKEVLKFGYEQQGKKVSLTLIIGILTSLLGLALPFGSKIIFGVAIAQLNKTLLEEVGIGIFIAAIASALYQFSQGFLIFNANSISGNRIETALWDRLLKLPAGFFKKYSVGDLWSRINGLISIRRSFNNYYITLIFSGIFSIFYLIAMAFFSIYLTMIAVVISLICLAATFAGLYLTVKYQQKSLEIKGKISGFIVQVIAGIGKIRVAGAEKMVFSQWAKTYAQQKKYDLKSQMSNTAITTIFAMLPTFSFLCFFFLIIYFLMQPENSSENLAISRGDFFGFIVAFGAFSGAVVGSVPALTSFYRQSRPAWKRVKILFESEVEDDPKKIIAPKIEGQVVVDQISFRYEPNGVLILDNVSIKAHPGEFIAIVGPSGGGKSTLIRLLLGFEKPETGSIYYDGLDLSHLNARSVRKQMGVVLQRGTLTSGTIYENIVYGGIYSKKQVERALELSGFHLDIENFPMGLHTVIPNEGSILSGGQRQRLLIARALISDPKILILDEATSALDNRAQEMLSKNIESLQVTRIVIAHRLSTIKHADRIYVLERGKILQTGTFEELSKAPGRFAEFLQRHTL